MPMYPTDFDRMVERLARARFSRAVGLGPARVCLRKDPARYSAKQLRTAASQYGHRAAHAVGSEKLEYEALARRFTEEAEDAEHWQQPGNAHGNGAP
jgi:hypothetical protein